MNDMLAQLAAGFPSGMNFGSGLAPQQPNPMQTGPMAGTPIMPQQQGGMPQPMPSQMPQFGSANGTMGLGSPFFTERPTGGLPTQQFTPTRDNAMGGNAMAMLGMSPNFGNMVGPTSALPPEMQPQGSQLKMWGMEDQMAQPDPAAPAGPSAPVDTMQPPLGFLQNPYWNPGVGGPQFITPYERDRIDYMTSGGTDYMGGGPGMPSNNWR